ncbi:glycosyltransferase family 4 protein [Sedimentisphaera salicampi]|uniref:glycosyltransferase family 4 protein n=1 Tax=Sedimentisphaera salicampi TaxID=1941349 RepID=UPI000B9CACB6|nr:glycosyltransferase family 4 protein [Sedimentisphaera salicampi]OXU15566.1 Spore coat protein SA [Sedimentisphaera salicampi]
MKILYIHQYFTTPSGFSGTRSYEFARRWVAAGHDVTVITGKHDLSGLEADESVQYLDGIKVVSVGTNYSNEYGYLRRIFSFLIFIVSSFFAALFERKVDVVYATSTPLTVGIPALLLRFFRRVPYVFEVRDQWPESIVQLGVIKNKFIIKILSCFEKIFYKYSASIVAVSEGMALSVREIAQNKRVYTVPNGADLKLFNPELQAEDIRINNGWEDKIVFMHAGSMSRINGLDFIIHAAERVSEIQDLHFLLIGSGCMKENLKKHAKELKLNNVTILPSVPKVKLPYYFAASDVALSIIGNFKIIEEHASLNKFYDSLSAGKPVLLNYSGWQRDLIEGENAGLGAELCNLEEFVEDIMYLKNNKQKLKEMGLNARKIAEKHFDRQRLADYTLDIIRKALTK